MRPHHPTLPLGRVLAVAATAALAAGCHRSQASDTPRADVIVGEGFTPSSLTLASGGPGTHRTVTFLRTTDETCATEVVFPDLKIDAKLPLNRVVPIELPTDTARTLKFQCGMGMYKGAVVVKPR